MVVFFTNLKELVYAVKCKDMNGVVAFNQWYSLNIGA